jgi:hypothetical protein
MVTSKEVVRAKQAAAILEAKVLETLKEKTPKGPSGQLRRSWKVTDRRTLPTPKGVSIKFTVTNPTEYGVWVNDGTGIYGPTRKRIRPKTAKVLRWKGSDGGPGGTSGGYVYRSSVKGQKKHKGFVEDAIASLRRSYPSAIFKRNK